jgi:hypothetical protein
MTHEINSLLIYDFHEGINMSLESAGSFVSPWRDKERRRIPMLEMLETKGLFALEYSPRTKTLRIEDLAVVLKHNLGCFAKGEGENGYVILAIAASRQELRQFGRDVVKPKETR